MHLKISSDQGPWVHQLPGDGRGLISTRENQLIFTHNYGLISTHENQLNFPHNHAHMFFHCAHLGAKAQQILCLNIDVDSLNLMDCT